MPKLLTKFLITGGNTIDPRPRTPQASLTGAIDNARKMVANRGFTDDCAIIWKPSHIVKRDGQVVGLEIGVATLVTVRGLSQSGVLESAGFRPPPPETFRKPDPRGEEYGYFTATEFGAKEAVHVTYFSVAGASYSMTFDTAADFIAWAKEVT